MSASLSAYWGCDEARLMDLYMRQLTPWRYYRAMGQLSREITKYSQTSAFKQESASQSLREKRLQRTRIRKMDKGFIPYRHNRQRTDRFGINAQQGASDAAYISTYVDAEGTEQRLTAQQASLPRQRRWATQPSTGIQARMMQKLGLRFDSNTEKSKPVSQTWIRQNISQLHGLSLLLALSDRQFGELSEWTNLPKRDVFQCDPQWVRAIAAAVLLS